jgi:hypothetical protein
MHLGLVSGRQIMFADPVTSLAVPDFRSLFVLSVDQGLRLPNTKQGDGFYFAYGGDFGDTCNDAQFCCNVSDYVAT